jgi:SagB-type dehydrogenase family enzyme
MLPADDVTSLALFFHLNSAPRLNEEAPPDAPYEVQYNEMAGAGPALALPRSGSPSPVLRLLQQRRSCRTFRPQPLPLAVLGTVLEGTYAVNRMNRLADGLSFLARSVPSAGGLYPLEVYVLAQRVLEVADGLYHYSVLGHSLEPVRTGDFAAPLGRCLVDQYYFASANAVVFFSAVFRRTLAKYGPRGYRYILLEAGHAAQNLCLLAAEQGLGSVCIGGFFDARLNQFLGLDGVSEGVVYCVGVGHAAE